MRRELEEKLITRWSVWLRSSGAIRIGDGWFDLVWRLCEDLEPLVANSEKDSGEPFEVYQVKEKFGGLRFYTNSRADAIAKRIESAQMESFSTCEVCGRLGVPRGEGEAWSHTLCDVHAE